VEPSQKEPGNLILAALPDGEMQIMREQGQTVSVHEGKMLQAAGGPADSLLFPTTAALSLIAVTQDGRSVETGLVGREGMVGLPQFFGHHAQPLECMTQHGGELCQFPTTAIRQATLPTLQLLLFRYANYRLAELAQAAVCNKFHFVRQRLSRWLLTAQDRTGKGELDFTQEMLSAIVGARRPVVTSLIGRMEDEGLIEYRRGCVKVVNRSGLEQAACECYGILSKTMSEFLRALPGDAA